MKPAIRVCMTQIEDAESIMIRALEKLRGAEDLCQRLYCDDGPAPAYAGLLDIAVRALSQANDAARYARHAMRNDEAGKETT